ncbi:MAG: cytochrome b5 domain-containing protein, partial [Candidatus Woesearchaeota archaeon]
MKHTFVLMIILTLFIVGCSESNPQGMPSINGDDTQTPDVVNSGDEPPLQLGSGAIEETAKVSKSELALHNSEDDCWISYDGNVFDVTDYVPMHPGGASKIVPLCGTSDKFENAFSMQHGTSKVSTLEKMGVYKGELI